MEACAVDKRCRVALLADGWFVPVSEAVLDNGIEQALVFMRSLKAIGCAFALDDFGSGVSSFGYLKNLPVDYVKVDGTFVRDICEDSTARVMVASINNIAQEMGLKTVAEFVENQAIVDELRDLGVDYAQGYHLGKPGPLSELLEVRMMPR